MTSQEHLLEGQILTLTARTPSGASCRLGRHAFKVYYTQDYWEWEYRGLPYFDPLDLAEAMLDQERRIRPAAIRTGKDPLQGSIKRGPVARP